MKNINLGAHFLFLLMFCSIKIERLLFLKFLKNLAFLTAIFGHLTSLRKKLNPFLQSVQSYLQSEMFLSNSVDTMKNLQQSCQTHYHNMPSQISTDVPTLSPTNTGVTENYESTRIQIEGFILVTV